MSGPKLPRLRTGIPPLDRLFSVWASAIERGNNLTAQAPLQILRQPAGDVVVFNGPMRKRVKLTSVGASGGSYNAVEVYPTAGGGWAVLTGGWSGLCWEWNLANISLSNPVYVEIEWVGSASEWRFQLGSCS